MSHPSQEIDTSVYPEVLSVTCVNHTASHPLHRGPPPKFPLCRLAYFATFCKQNSVVGIPFVSYFFLFYYSTCEIYSYSYCSSNLWILIAIYNFIASIHHCSLCSVDAYLSCFQYFGYCEYVSLNSMFIVHIHLGMSDFYFTYSVLGQIFVQL